MPKSKHIHWHLYTKSLLLFQGPRKYHIATHQKLKRKLSLPPPPQTKTINIEKEAWIVEKCVHKYWYIQTVVWSIGAVLCGEIGWIRINGPIYTYMHYGKHLILMFEEKISSM